MKLLGKTLLMIVVDGVEFLEVIQLRKGFEEEGALILTTTPQRYLTVMAEQYDAAPRELVVDVPMDSVEERYFEALILPEGIDSVFDKEDETTKILELVRSFYILGIPIIASGDAAVLLHNDGLRADHVVVRDGNSMDNFLENAVSVVCDTAPLTHMYRPTIVS